MEPAADLDHQMAAARAEGIPLTPADLRKGPKLDPKDNAANDYRAIYPTLDELERKHLLPTDPWYSPVMRREASPAHLKQAEEFDRIMAPVWPKLKAAAAKPGLDFELQWEQGPKLMLTDYSRMRNLAKALIYRVRKGIYKLDDAAALDSLLTAARLAAQLQHEQALTAFVDRIYIDGLVITELQYILIQTAPARPTLEGARKVLNALGPPLDIRMPLAGEPTFAFVTMRMLEFSEISGAYMDKALERNSADLLLAAEVDGLLQANEAHYLQDLRQLYRDLPGDREDFVQLKRATSHTEALRAEHRGLAFAMSEFLLPYVSTTCELIQTDAARRRSAAEALSILEHYGRTGGWPAELPIGGKAGQDPFDGAPLRYHRTGAGFIIYSVGPDLVDDGGKRKVKGSKRFDINFGLDWIAATIGRPAKLEPPLRAASNP